ncbi:finTRIM family, member 14 [Silurus asotus]|uniref:FinTRIM family, member 14 n=1 Tax=Silurus asotus TaxID=30991 RepID=A0AAD5AJL4_SILAS|nr:finTRIM family, member 14 [Silurus asotus]
MAEASISVNQDQFICAVCLDLLKDPVTTPCGHSFCKVCINGCWDQEDQKGVYSCPQCRHTFTPRPVLHRNNMLAEVVEKLKKTTVQDASPIHCYAGPGDVECDFCIGKKHKAVRSCLVCVASYCETHLKPHHVSPAFKNHTLTEASAKLREKICTEHNKLIEIYCRTDQSCICYMCTMDKHKGHDTITASAERAEKQTELKEEQIKFQHRIQEKQKKVQELKQAVNIIKIFTEMISSMEKKRSEVTELIRDQEKAELSRPEQLLEQLEQEISDLQRRITELEQLSHTQDHIYFLQSFQSLCVSAGRRSPTEIRPDFDTSSITVYQHHLADGMRNYFSDLKKRLEEICEEKFNKIPSQESTPHSLSLYTLGFGSTGSLDLLKMAEASISVDQDQFICPVCLDLLNDPVTVHCGHSFCKVCINGHWDEEYRKGVYSCPQCRDSFPSRPDLRRNNMLAEVVEKLKKFEVQSSALYHCNIGPGDVECDFCTGRKHKAIKSCLMCLASFCEIHLKPHLDVPCLMKHTLIEASVKLKEKICSKHDKLIEIYCRTDQTCICYLCTLDEHKGHDTITALAGKAEKQTELKVEQMKSHQRIQEKQKKVQELKQDVNIIKLSAQTAVDDSEKIFTELISLIEKKRLEVREMIRDQEKAELSRAERLLEQLEQEISDLQRRITELEELSHTHDHIHFLQSFQSLHVSAGRGSPSADRPNFNTSIITLHQQHLSDKMRNYFSDLRKRLEEFCEERFNRIPAQDFYYLNLDLNTAHYYLILSEKNRVVRYSKIEQRYSDHPERFDSCIQVLSKESVCGRCYWEVEWSSDEGVYISVSYKDISRKGRDIKCRFGRNNQSWSLRCSSSPLSFFHNNIKTDLRVPSPSRIGVYVDHSEGTLSFYSVSDTMKLLHRVHTTFTQPLYAGFGINWVAGSMLVKLCDPE